MKCRSLFSGKIIFNLSSTELAFFEWFDTEISNCIVQKQFVMIINILN